MHCEHIRCTVVRIRVYGWIVQCSGHSDTKACPSAPSRLFPVSPEREVGMDKCKLGVISQERLKINVMLLLSANMKSYMPRRMAQPTDDLE